MRPMLPWMVFAVLCCTSSKQRAERAITTGHMDVANRADADAQDAGVDPRLLEAQSAFDEATKLREAGQYVEAIPMADHALSLREAALGETHVDVAKCLNLKGILYRLQADYTRAEPFLQRGLAIREAALGKAHPLVADSLNNLTGLYRAQGKYDRAEPLAQRALAIREAALGKSHPEVAASLDTLANLYREQGKYDHAEPLLQRGLSIREAGLGKAHTDVATSLNSLGILYDEWGQYDRARALYAHALAIREAALGKSHPDVAASLNNLAVLYWAQGLYYRAEPLHERALAIREAALGKSHPDVAASLNNLANLYSVQGLYSRAVPLYERTLAIREAALGKSHPDVAGALNNLAIVYRRQGRYDRAKALCERAIAIREAALGKSHPNVAVSLYNLANVYAQQEQYDRAEPLYERALAIREAALGGAHPYVANSFDKLAALYDVQGQHARARRLYERALAIREAALGKSHPDVVASLNNLAQLCLRQGRLADATPLFTRALAISEGRLRREALDFSESRLASFLQLLGEDEQRLYSLVQVHPDNSDVRRLALATALLFKGRSVEEAADTSRTILQRLGPEDRDVFERLRGFRTHLAKLSLNGPGKLALAKYQQRLKKLADEGDALEADLAKRSAPLRALTTLPPSHEVVGRVASALPRDGVLIQFVSYMHRPPAPRPGTPYSKLPAQPRYLAMLLFAGGHTSAVDLGPATPIDAAASRLRDALASRDARFQAAAQKLYEITFKPLLPLLGNARKLFVAPDGQLALVPFAALHDGRRFLADTFDFAYLTSGADLLRPDGIPNSPSVVIFADPDYSAAAPVAQASVRDGGVTLDAAERSHSVERFFAERRMGLFEQRWTPLPGTRQEAEAIQRLIPQAQLFVGLGASKERLVNLAPPGILHIATHGFFLEDATAASGGRGLAVTGELGGGPLLRLGDPLLRSGLILAGTAAPADLSNSMVTALELAGLNLWGTELVVLSACDTGRGDVKRGQGVYGLRRSLVVAGAETLVVSLWKVDDETTWTMMESYYRNLLAGQGRVEALNKAMLSLRAQHPHPYYWAPFIAIGRNAPLRQFANPAPKP